MTAVSIAHEHTPTLVEVVFDEAGHSVREYSCASCFASWFE